MKQVERKLPLLAEKDSAREVAELKLLQNSGVLVHNKPQVALPEKTVLVLGLARGGTTMVASVLEALGVYMGEKLGPVLEDVALSNAVEARDIRQVKEIIAQRDATHSIWGWKRPSSIEFSKVWEGRFRNPYIIAVFRDPFAIANRNRISMLADVFQNMERSVQQLGQFVQLLQHQKCPVLLCSYEKVLASPESFVQEVDEFLGLNAHSHWPAAVSQIGPASKGYLESSRITQSLGHIDIANKRFCSGWAFYPQHPAKQAKVQIFVNDKLVHSVVAQQLRSDVKESGIHPTGLCGFKFEWPAEIKLKVGDQVIARVEGDNKALKGSPKKLEAAPANTRGALPTFYCIGAQKAGTTWLHAMLMNHSQIHLPKRKEMHYWDVHNNRPLEWYLDHFVSGKINGDITPSYAILPEPKVAELHKLTPEAKIIFSMRNPVDRAWSFLQMEIMRNFKICPEDLMAGNPQGASLEFVRNKLFHPGCLARNDYATTIRRWRRVFGAEAIMLFRYERISQDPRGLLTDICRHIGADTAWAKGLPEDLVTRTVFSSEKIPFPVALRSEYAEACAKYVDDLEQLLGEHFDDWRA